METDSTDEDTAAPTKKGRHRNRKRKDKTVLAVEGSEDAGAAKKASGSVVPPYHGGVVGLSLSAHRARCRAGARARSPLAPALAPATGAGDALPIAR